MELNPIACFNMIGQAISEIFEKKDEFKERKKIWNNKIFLKSKTVQAWCDCSHNFEQEKLIKMYNKKICQTK